MRPPQTREVLATRNKVDELLKLVPNKRFSECTTLEKEHFAELELAMQDHRTAVRQARVVITKHCSTQLRRTHARNV